MHFPLLEASTWDSEGGEVGWGGACGCYVETKGGIQRGTYCGHAKLAEVLISAAFPLHIGPPSRAVTSLIWVPGQAA